MSAKDKQIGLNDLSKMIHDQALSKGFWGKERETGTLLMLCASELSEALEADRKGKYARLGNFNYYMSQMNEFDSEELHEKIAFKEYIKDSFEDELADTIMRVLDLCAHHKIDIEKHIELKMRYNQTRAKMHNKLY